MIDYDGVPRAAELENFTPVFDENVKADMTLAEQYKGAVGSRIDTAATKTIMHLFQEEILPVVSKLEGESVFAVNCGHVVLEGRYGTRYSTDKKYPGYLYTVVKSAFAPHAYESMKMNQGDLYETTNDFSYTKHGLCYRTGDMITAPPLVENRELHILQGVKHIDAMLRSKQVKVEIL